MAKSKPAKKTKAKPKVKVKPTIKAKAKAKAPAKPVKKKVAARSAKATAPARKRTAKAPTKAAPKKAAKPMTPHLLGDAVPKMTAPANGDVLQTGCLFSVSVQTDFCQSAHSVYMFNAVTLEQTRSMTLTMTCNSGGTGAGVGTCRFTAPGIGKWQFYIVYVVSENGDTQTSAGSSVTVQ